MNSQVGLDLMCHIHNQKVVSVKMSENGDPLMYCLKCLTPDQISIEQLSQQLTDLRSKKIRKLIELDNQSEKRFISLKKVFQSIKDMFNKQIDDIIKNVDNLMNETKQTLKQQTQTLQQPINQLSITQVVKHLKELKEEVIINQQQQYDHMKIKFIEQYLQLIKSLNKQIKGELVQPQQQDNQIIQIDNTEQENEQNQQLIGQYQIINEQEVSSCVAITMDQDEKIIVTGQSKDINIWEMDNNRQISLKHTLCGHEQLVTNICFGCKGYWFICTGYDQQMIIWQYLEQGEWKCKQIIQNEERANQIIITNDDQQIISCHLDYKIRIWMKQDQWECYQTLNGHTNSVLFISLSFNEQNLISSEYDMQLILWQKGSDLKWNQKYQIDDDCFRISFISNNELRD